MSLLQIQNDPAQKHDASSEGEDLAKGSSHPLWAALIATVVIVAAIAVFVAMVRKYAIPAEETSA